MRRSALKPRQALPNGREKLFVGEPRNVVKQHRNRGCLFDAKRDSKLISPALKLVGDAGKDSYLRQPVGGGLQILASHEVARMKAAHLGHHRLWILLKTLDFDLRNLPFARLRRGLARRSRPCEGRRNRKK